MNHHYGWYSTCRFYSIYCTVFLLSLLLILNQLTQPGLPSWIWIWICIFWWHDANFDAVTSWRTFDTFNVIMYPFNVMVKLTENLKITLSLIVRWKTGYLSWNLALRVIQCFIAVCVSLCSTDHKSKVCQAGTLGETFYWRKSKMAASACVKKCPNTDYQILYQ